MVGIVADYNLEIKYHLIKVNALSDALNRRVAAEKLTQQKDVLMEM